jgi:hypothetical protein
MSEHRSAAEARSEQGISAEVGELAPKDAAVAIRSIPRRFREVFAQLEPDDDPRAWRAVVEHAIVARDAMETTAGHLRHVLIEARPELHEVTVDGAHVAVTADVKAILADLQRAAEGLARTIDSVDAGDWRRPAVLNGNEVTALDIVRHAVLQSVSHLRMAEQAATRAKEDVG